MPFSRHHVCLWSILLKCFNFILLFDKPEMPMAATMDDKTPCRKLINCIFNRFFYGFDFGFISWICSSHLNNKYKLFHSWLVYIVLFKAAPKIVSLLFSRLTFLCNNSPASPLWNFPEARNGKGTESSYCFNRTTFSRNLNTKLYICAKLCCLWNCE